MASDWFGCFLSDERASSGCAQAGAEAGSPLHCQSLAQERVTADAWRDLDLVSGVVQSLQSLEVGSWLAMLPLLFHCCCVGRV